MSTHRSCTSGHGINFQSIPKSLGIPTENKGWFLIETDCNDMIRRHQIKPTCTPTLAFKQIEEDTRWVLSASWNSVNVHLLIKYWPNGRCGYTTVDDYNRVIMTESVYKDWVQSLIKLHGPEAAQQIITAPTAPVIDPMATRLGEELIRYWEAFLQLNLFVPEVTT